MYDSHKCVVLIFLVANIFGFGTSQQFFCYDNNNGNNFTSNSAYGNNLNVLLSSLSSNVNAFGFYNASAGQNPDQVNAITLCRADVELNLCRSCVNNATLEVVRLCPNRKKAIFWDDLCFVRYSNTNISGTLEVFPRIIGRNTANVSDPERYSDDLRTLLDRIRGSAVSGGPLLKVGADTRTAVDYRTIYGMVQCSPDLSSDSCDACLREVAKNMQGLPEGSQGLRILAPSCNIRFELASFYNEAALRERITAATPTPPPPPPPPGNDDNNNNNTTRTVIIVVVSSVACLILAVCIWIFLRRRGKQKSRQKPESVEDMSIVESIQYDFDEIRVATDDFSNANKLGQGGFGGVYMGLLENGQKIAVKRLSRDFGQGDLEFKNEVVLVARLQHRNLVRLLGFSIEGTERLLIYEFVQNASLDHFLFDSIKRSILDWDTRYKIIGGIVKGLLYLHEDSRLRIIHRDLKASNILLDGEMAPKIADFGMARLFTRDETQGNTSRIVGTYGYMAPEYAMHGHFSIKSDVYSFGVLALEILTGQKNNAFRNGENVEDIVTCAWKHWREGTAIDMIDPILKSGSGSMREILRCFHISLLCVQENAASRPTMANVALMLNNFSLSLPLPSEPAYFVSGSFEPDAWLLHDDSLKELESSKSSEAYKVNRSADYSKTEVSVSEILPR